MDTDGLLRYLADDRGLDLRDYRRDTIEKGIRQRLQAVGAPDARSYVRRLESDPSEIDRLLEAVVVPYTELYRDPEVFEAVAGVVLPRLLGAGARPGPLRAWCIGAATGEEAWTLAMLLADVCPRADLACFDVLASDREPGLMSRAAAGRYPAASAARLPERLRRFLAPDGDALAVAPSLRARVRFASHDLMGPVLAPPEAVVAAFDLVLLRNVLIYFERSLQEKALARVTAVLEPGGALVLGHVETLPDAVARAYETFPGTSPRLRIYRRAGR